VKTPKGNRPTGDMRRCEEVVEVNHKDRKWKGVEWNLLALDREQWQALLNTIRNLQFP
jgi:hypothetical protein